MPSSSESQRAAEIAREALRSLAHATRVIDEPQQVYPVLGSLSSSVAALSQSLHQIAAAHDRRAHTRTTNPHPPPAEAPLEVAWELHRAADILRQAGERIDHAHNVEGKVIYRESPATRTEASRSSTHTGLHL